MMRNPAAYLTAPEQRDTLDSLCELDAGRLYVMDYTADYRLDELLTANVSDNAALAQFVRTRLLSGAPEQTGDADAGCSGFFAKAPGGGFLTGRNYDYRMDASTVLLRTRPEGAYASLGLVCSGWGGYSAGSLSDGTTDLSMTMGFPYLVMDGMNERGLYIGVLKLDGPRVVQRTGKPVAATTVLMRLALDRSASVGEAAALFAAYDMSGVMAGCDFHFHVADAAGRSAVIEYVDNRMHIIDSDAVTNFYLHPSVTDGGTGRMRHTLIKNALACRGGLLTRTDAMALLRLVRQDSPEGDTGVTQWSAVYDLTARATDVAVKTDYTRVFHFSLYGSLRDAMWT